MRDRVISWLEKNVSQHRLQHILGVEQTCIDLARCHQLNQEKAAQAGLMHDLAKFFPPKKLLKIAEEAKITIDEVCLRSPHLLHADVSAVVAQQEFDIKDPKILKAIANHTLGTPGMSKLSCLVFIADALEPNRGDNAELNAMRATARENLYKCVRQTSDYSLKYLVSQQKIIHPRTILTRNWALAKAKKN
ncbi:bis(5'-nucleosyl)-tetraphosphatase (symmetrical) YqeK [Waterburya agarophytonicola K14]|uniref:bis(5'-nucleosyl)-tetraphosphatase (symmetrical) n=1 Tax=Waterburya agarophytonicola KI4 TaxID=2874699 RepID=A0A964BLV8_9CYAN|nr:bis(5'-nucleosyl)-tetraphosphatase (symmetrical) YqeK [Waterburya agarophytonicola]MCC0175789.1 bis(5'-nucleosyl)-tetraphosphatase (symmetrical) YqeK [Waterburya agarophytonicola KI4]